MCGLRWDALAIPGGQGRDADNLDAVLNELPRDREIILYCT